MIVVAPIQRRNPQEIPHGLIHHWVGAVFVPQTTLDQVVPVLHSYDQYAEIYRPNIVCRLELVAAEARGDTLTLAPMPTDDLPTRLIQESRPNLEAALGGRVATAAATLDGRRPEQQRPNAALFARSEVTPGGDYSCIN